MLDLAPEVRALIRAAGRGAMIPAAARSRGPVLSRGEVERLLPHRDPFLLIDEITFVDRGTPAIVCRCDLERSAPTFAGHFPGRPLWPGVLQVEAIGQAGLCLARLLAGSPGDRDAPGFALTHILGAEFIRPVRPAGGLEIVSRLLPDGLFTILVGQCLQQDAVCCVAAVRGINQELES